MSNSKMPFVELDYVEENIDMIQSLKIQPGADYWKLEQAGRIKYCENFLKQQETEVTGPLTLVALNECVPHA